MKLPLKKLPASPSKSLKAKPPLSLHGVRKAPAPKSVDPLERLSRAASSFNQNSEASAVTAYILAGLCVARSLRANNDEWIDFCRHERWSGQRNRPKPSVRSNISDWVYRFASPDVPIRRRGTLMQAFKVLFDAGYSCTNAKRVLASNDVAAIAQLDHVSQTQSDIGLLQQRLNLQRAASQPRINVGMPFLVLRLVPEYRKALAQALLPESKIRNCSIELAIDEMCTGKAFRAKNVIYSDNGGV